MSTSSPLQVGLVGYGYAGKTFHVPLLDAAGLALRAVCSSRADAVRAELPAVMVDASPEALFARPEIDLVVLASPNDTHYPLACAALAAGKHVVIDKPFTLDAREAADLIARARAAVVMRISEPALG